MKIEFDVKDLEDIVLAHVKKMGIKCNTVEFSGYRSALIAEATFEVSDFTEVKQSSISYPEGCRSAA